MDKKIAILMVDFPFCFTMNNENIEFFAINYPFAGSEDWLSNFGKITITKLENNFYYDEPFNLHYHYCQNINNIHQERLYSSLDSFSNILIISEFGGECFGSLNIPDFCKNLSKNGKIITLCYTLSPKFFGRKKTEMGRQALEDSLKYVKNSIFLGKYPYPMPNNEHLKPIIANSIEDKLNSIINLLN